ncbi:MAG: type II toxin-antitoxin system VapC family toxin [Gammaproteobacteria bacterium]
MRAVDTNVLARYYLQDDSVQSRIASELLAAGDLFVPKTVILEFEWVLHSVAGQPAGKVLDCLAHLLALPGVTVEDHEQVESALRSSRRGLDFADALHLAASDSCTEVLTFDARRYARRAARLKLKPPVRVPAA